MDMDAETSMEVLAWAGDTILRCGSPNAPHSYKLPKPPGRLGKHARIHFLGQESSVAHYLDERKKPGT